MITVTLYAAGNEIEIDAIEHQILDSNFIDNEYFKLRMASKSEEVGITLTREQLHELTAKLNVACDKFPLSKAVAS
jgi:hypothetical protein